MLAPPKVTRQRPTAPAGANVAVLLRMPVVHLVVIGGIVTGSTRSLQEKAYKAETAAPSMQKLRGL